MSLSARGIAVEALVRVEHGAFSNVVLPAMLRRSDLDARDRAFATDLVYGTLRRQRTLDARLARVVDRPLDALDPPVRAALRMGAYQLAGAVPAHAAVSETVAAAPARARGLVNAVLRRLAATDAGAALPDGDSTRAVAVRLSYPDWLVDRLVTDLGRGEALAALAASNQPGVVTLRPNASRAGGESLAGELDAAGATVEPGELGIGALRARGLGDVATLPAVAEGRATPQDEASQAVVAALEPRAGDRVLDVAAAPGGKAGAIGERVGRTGAVLAVDVHRGRLRLVAEGASRLRLGNVHPVRADGRALPVASGSFDRVLVDAPCSGLGVLRRRPEARWRVRERDIAVLASLQRELLHAAADAVAPGGTLVYSVCTLTAAETVDVDAWLEERRPDLVAAPAPGPPWRAHGRGALLLPHDAGTDGMFVLRVVRGPDG